MLKRVLLKCVGIVVVGGTDVAEGVVVVADAAAAAASEVVDEEREGREE